MAAVRSGLGGASVMTQAWLRTPRPTLLLGAFTAEAHVMQPESECTLEPPIVVVEGHDVMVFRTVDDAARALEGPDVLEGIYEAYDATGVRIDLTSDGGPDDYSAVVALSVPAVPPVEAARLCRLLQEHLEHAGATVAVDASVARLLDAVIALRGFAR